MDFERRNTDKCQPLVSVVTPSYSQGEFIEDTILSVKNQHYPNIEHIVVDGGSSDNTLEILRKYQNVYNLRWVSEQDKGQTDAVNKGISMAKGEIIGWLNSDDCYTLDALKIAVEAFRDVPEAGMIFGEHYIMDGTGSLYGKRAAKGFKQEAIIEHPEWVCSPSMFVKRSVLLQTGALDVNLSYAMDYDLFIRLSRITQIISIPIPMVYFRKHKRSKTQTSPSAHWREVLDIHRKYDGRLISPIWLRYLATKVWVRLPGIFKDVVRKGYYGNNDIPNTQQKL